MTNAAADVPERTKRTPAELKKASKFLYLGMRYASKKLEFFLRSVHTYENDEDLGRVISFHDAFLIDAMKLMVFFYSKPHHVEGDDCIAEDFFSDPEIWRDLIPERSIVLARTYKDVFELLAHYSYQSDGYPSSRFDWNTSDIYVELFNTLQVFLGHVDPALLIEPMYELREDNPQIRICRPIYSNTQGENQYRIAAPGEE